MTSGTNADGVALLLLQGLRCDHDQAVIGQQLQQVIERRSLLDAIGEDAAGAGATAASVSASASALAEDSGAAEAEVVTEEEWLDLAKVSQGVA